MEDKKLAEQAAKKKEAKEVPVKKEDPRPLSARSAPTDADAGKRAKLQPKFDKIKTKVQSYKDSAVDEVKKGSYAEAIAVYKKAAEVLEIAYEDFGVFKREIAQQEAAIFNNIAHCFGKDQHDKASIDYSTKVIDRALYIEDVLVLVKAFLRRAAAYEHIERFKLAVDDLLRVRELQPQNKQAQTGITRCQKYIKQDTGAAYNPSNDDLKVNDLSHLKGSAPTM